MVCYKDSFIIFTRTLSIALVKTKCSTPRHEKVWANVGKSPQSLNTALAGGRVFSFTFQSLYSHPVPIVWGWIALKASLDTVTKKKILIPAGIEPNNPASNTPLNWLG
jgi:hypothetical protein